MVNIFYFVHLKMIPTSPSLPTIRESRTQGAGFHIQPANRQRQSTRPWVPLMVFSTRRGRVPRPWSDDPERDWRSPVVWLFAYFREGGRGVEFSKRYDTQRVVSLLACRGIGWSTAEPRRVRTAGKRDVNFKKARFPLDWPSQIDIPWPYEGSQASDIYRVYSQGLYTAYERKI